MFKIRANGAPLQRLADIIPIADNQVKSQRRLEAKLLPNQPLEQIARNAAGQGAAGDRQAQAGNRQAVLQPKAIREAALRTASIAISVNMPELARLDQSEVAWEAVSSGDFLCFRDKVAHGRGDAGH